MIKHISFDFWNTLVVFNPEFSRQRPEVMATMTGYSVEETTSAYKKVKRHLDDLAEIAGLSIASVDTYRMFLKALGYGDDHVLASRLDSALSSLVRDLPPIVRQETIEALSGLNDAGMTYSVTSNTNYISGRVLRDVVAEWGVGFKFGLFSDEIGIAKPNPKLFEMVSEMRGVSLSEIVHVGDHTRCDRDGAARMGMHTILVSGPAELPDTLTQFMIPA